MLRPILGGLIYAIAALAAICSCFCNIRCDKRHKPQNNAISANIFPHTQVLVLLYTDQNAILDKMIGDLPNKYSTDLNLRAQITEEIKSASTENIMFQRYIKKFGSKNFEALFPLT